MRHLSTDLQQNTEFGRGTTHQLRRYRRPNLPFLFYTIMGRNWDAALRRIHSHRDEIFSVEDMSGDTVLHYACRLDPPVAIVETLAPIFFEKNREGATALHVAVCYRCSAGVIRAMVEGEHSQEAKTPLPLLLSNKARIPLHYACSSFRGLGLEGFRILLDATIQAHTWSERGLSKSDTKSEHLEVVHAEQTFHCDDDLEWDDDVERNNAFTMQDSLGHTPLSLLFKRYRERVKYVIRSLERNPPCTSAEAAHRVQSELGGLWMKARLIVCRMVEKARENSTSVEFDRHKYKCPQEAAVAREAARWAAQRYQSNDYEQNDDEEASTCDKAFRLVHASVALAGYGCPIEMVRLAMSVYPNQTREMDDDGNLPLHIAAVASSYMPSHAVSASDEDSLISNYSYLAHASKPFGKIIGMLLRSYPEAAKIPHGMSGRLPLILALDAKQRSMDDGVQLLIDAYPAALESKEFDPKLYPYILSRIGKVRKSTPIADENHKFKSTAGAKTTPKIRNTSQAMPLALFDYLKARPHLLLSFNESRADEEQ